MEFHYHALPDDLCRAWREGAPDANGQVPERMVSDGAGHPCRCCLCDIPEGHDMLILACRPFETLNPYAEVGPVFICSGCARYDEPVRMPPVMTSRARHLLKGYSRDDRIVGGTGAIVETPDIPAWLEQVFSRDGVRYVDVRSATNNCFTLRIFRAP